MLITGGYGGQDRAWLFDPRNERWTETGKLGVGRLYPALAALPDGRAFVAGCDRSGTASDDNPVRIKAALGAELFDPASNQWLLLPNMPLSFRVDAYGAEGPSATVMPDGSLIMGGAMHRYLLRLDAQGKNFAPYWRVSDPLDSQRVGGIVQAIGNDEIVVSGGRMRTASGQCCQTRGDGQRLRFPRPGEARRVSLGLPLRGGAVAHRHHRSFIGGGEESFSMGFTSTQASAVAELIDHRSGEVRELASLPRPIAAGKAIWLDDDRIFVKAIARPAYGQDGRTYEFPTAGYLAVYSLKRNQWQPLFEPSIAQAELAGRSGKNVLMVSNDAQVWSFNADTFTLEELPRPVHMRGGGVQRVLTDGRLILAGGATQSELLEAYDIDCRSSDCPLQRFAYGPLVNTQHYEIYSPATKRWTTSALSRGAGESAVIRRDGRVMSLGRISDQSNGQWLIEQSDSQGKRWQRLPMPTELDPSICAGNSDSSDKNCSLLIGDLPEANLEAVLFAGRHWDNNQRDYFVDLWLFHEVGKWQSVARNLSSDALATRKFLLRRVDDKTLQATHFQSDQFRLSLE